MTQLFLFDQVWSQDRPNPNIAQHVARPYTAEWRRFSQVWPFSEPVGFYEHCRNHGLDVAAVEPAQLGTQSAIYPIAITWWDHTVDYIALIKPEVLKLIQSAQVSLVFFYTEGDDPVRIRQHITNLADQHRVPVQQTHFVSANSQADLVLGASYFPDDETLFLERNRACDPVQYHSQPRSHTFTCLNRTHKWWRCATMTRLQQLGALDRAIWSYDTAVSLDEDPSECAISLYEQSDLMPSMQQFLTKAPYQADDMDHVQHNNHELQIAEHYNNSYFQIVLETHFDADNSGGTFLTEKTFKPIKNAQPFVLFAPAHSLDQLRSLGYKTFDSVIDNSYDSVVDNNIRWQQVLKLIAHLSTQDLHQLYTQCQDDLLHNQEIFLSSKASRLNRVLKRIYEHS
jgi:hypothetical protein